MYKQDKVEKELFLDIIMIFQGFKDSSLRNITHKRGEMLFSLMNSLKVLRMGCLKKERKALFIDELSKVGLLFQIQSRLHHQPSLPKADVIVCCVLKQNDMSLASCYLF